MRIRWHIVATATATLFAGLLAGVTPALAAQGHPASSSSPAFNVGWRQPPANADLSGIACRSASMCMAVGSYTDALGGQRSQAQLWNGRAWRVLGSVPGTGLSGVSCPRASLCIAVGSVIDEWNGSTWHQMKQPAAAQRRALLGVSCPAASFCMAVGTDSGGEADITLRWNGTTWRAPATPDIGCVPFCGLSGVACRSASNCMAVGQTASDADDDDFSGAIRWDGAKWTLQNPAKAHFSTALSAVSCPGTADCLAVGNLTGASASACNCVLADGWNGAAWTELSTPPVEGTLDGVSCPAAGNCVAVGGTLAFTVQGSTWKQFPIVTPGETGSTLSAVSCWAAAACMAVGNFTELSGASLTLAEKWNGSTWTIARTFSPGDPFMGLSGVSCESASRCMAVGAYLNSSDQPQPLAEFWNGSRWRVVRTPSTAPAIGELLGVSCPTSSTCMAVGWFDLHGAPQPMGDLWNGSSFRGTVIGKHSGMFSSVSCPTSQRCLAVGSFTGQGKRETVAATWSGFIWKERPPVNPGATISELSGVSCNGPADCIAVGASNTDLTSPLRSLTEQFGAKGWQVEPNPGGARQLAAVSCPRHARCMAAGSTLVVRGPHLPSGTTGLAWNGTNWTVSRTTNQAGQLRAHLGGVSCAAIGSCQAVGSYATKAGNLRLIAQAWNGTGWRLLPVTAPSPAFNDLYGISCSSLNSCIAVGATGAEQTLAYRWNGIKWLLTKTLNP